MWILSICECRVSLVIYPFTPHPKCNSRAKKRAIKVANLFANWCRQILKVLGTKREYHEPCKKGEELQGFLIFFLWRLWNYRCDSIILKLTVRLIRTNKFESSPKLSKYLYFSKKVRCVSGGQVLKEQRIGFFINYIGLSKFEIIQTSFWNNFNWDVMTWKYVIYRLTNRYEW